MGSEFYLNREYETQLINTEFGKFVINYSDYLLLKSIREYNPIDMLMGLYEIGVEVDISYKEKIKSIFDDKKSFYASKKNNIKALCHYYNKFKLYQYSNIISNLFSHTYCSTDETEIQELKNVFSKVSYNTVLCILRERLEYNSSISRIILLFPKKYIEKENTIEMIASTNITFKSIGFFDNIKIRYFKDNIEKSFSFISLLPKEGVVKYIKPSESEIFIDVIANLINEDYFDDFLFSSLFLPYKNVLKEKVPFHIRRMLIDKITKRHKSFSFKIFEDSLSLLTKEEIEKLFANSTKTTIEEYLGKLYKCNHPIFEDKNFLTKLVMDGFNILKFVDIERLSKEELKLVKEYYNLDLVSDKVRVKLHPNINNKYKFEYEKDEMLPNGINREDFLSLRLNNKYDKFLFEFLINGSDIEILYTNYYNSYKNSIIKKYGEEKFLQIDTIYHFLKFILAEKRVNNEILMPNLEKIYNHLKLTNLQIEHIRNLMCTLDPSYEERINRFLIRQRNIAVSKYNYIVKMHLNGENINKTLEMIGLNKEELISDIIKMRNLYKEEKKTLIDLLRNEKYVITIGDILGFLQEMEENDYTIDEVLRLNGINKKYFYDLYKNMIYTNPELHAKIKEMLLNNKKRGFKKYIRFVYYITTLDFNDEEDFKNMFPELDLDKMIENMEKLEKNTLVRKLQEIKRKIQYKAKQIS